jgi:hypothetical protein
MNDVPGSERSADFKFGQLETDLLSITYTIIPTSTALSEVAKTFVQNMHRVVALGLLPRMLALNVALAVERIPFPLGAISGVSTPLPKDVISHIIMTATMTDAMLSRVPNEGTFLALEGLLSSMILGAWTAFETFAGDLWEAALNARPEELAKLSGRRGHRSDSGGEQATKDIDLNRLAQNKFDVSKTMGTLLRERFNFQILEGIRDAYECAFGQYCENARKALFDDSLRHLSAVRNLLVHKAGKIDHKFKDDTKTSPHFADSKPDEQIKIDGTVVADLVSRAVIQSIAMLMSVDKFVGAKLT